jgi:DNA-binding MarR family transcriptional regulator
MQEKTLMIFPAGQLALRKKPLTKADAQVLWWLVHNLPPSGAVVTQTRISVDCATSAAAVSRSFENLIKDGFVRRLSKEGTSYHYRLNPSWFAFV